MRIGSSETPTALLREMVRYVQVELVAEGICVSRRASAGEVAQDDARGGSSSDDFLIDDEVSK